MVKYSANAVPQHKVITECTKRRNWTELNWPISEHRAVTHYCLPSGRFSSLQLYQFTRSSWLDELLYVSWTNQLDVCSMFARSCKRGITSLCAYYNDGWGRRGEGAFSRREVYLSEDSHRALAMIVLRSFSPWSDHSSDRRPRYEEVPRSSIHRRSTVLLTEPRRTLWSPSAVHVCEVDTLTKWKSTGKKRVNQSINNAKCSEQMAKTAAEYSSSSLL